MKTEYKTIDTSTIKGIEESEKLLKNGWTIYRSGLFLVYLMKRTKV
jgi:hypothetical protein